MLELANREMAELEVLAELTDRFDIAAGVIDVKNSYVETATSPSGSIGCSSTSGGSPVAGTGLGFSQTARAVSRAKLQALVAGRDLVRGHG